MQAPEPAPDYPVVAVARLANYLKRKVVEDPKLRRLGVRGEITGLRVLPNGNVYFDLKDRDAIINCVSWSVNAARLPPLANGQAIVAVGSVDTFAKRSSYQLVVQEVEQGGIGRLHAVYAALKERLEAEGLFASSRKRALPKYPFRVALVSSPTANGAADFLTQAAAHAPHIVIEVFETAVQGENAAPDIVRALNRASRAPVDLVVLARGGGSYEDLFVFNDERVVRALARCAHPTVSAIGHEADAPLTDFVADHRAPTPSTAAQTVLPRRTDLLRALLADTRALDRSMNRLTERVRRELERIEVRSPLWAPERFLLGRRQTIDVCATDLQRAFDARLRRKSASLTIAVTRLEACNPSVQLSLRRERLTIARYRLDAHLREVFARRERRLAGVTLRLLPAAVAGVARRATRLRLIGAMLDGRDPTKILERGYAIVTAGGRALRDAAGVAPGTIVTAQLARGTLQARVEATANHGGE